MDIAPVDRRGFLGSMLAGVASSSAMGRVVLPMAGMGGDARVVRFAVIADLHHGLAPDAMNRLEAFVEAVNERRDELDFVLQMGDFCLVDRDAQPCLDLWNTIGIPKLHVLGNHDMDTCTKARAVEAWGMEHRYWALEVGGWRFLALDLNHIREGDARVDYANANFYVDAEKRSWADPEQLAWLDEQLNRDVPTIVLSHQPLGFWEPLSPMPACQAEVLEVLAPGRERRACLAACLCGHLHVDRVGLYHGIPLWCVNSASYLWKGGMVPYSTALFAFVTLDPEAGTMTIEGVEGEWAQGADERPELPNRPWVRPGISDKVEALAAIAGAD